MQNKTSVQAYAAMTFLLSGASLATNPQAADVVANIKSTSIARTDQAIVIDGKLNDAAWLQAVEVEDFHQIKPLEYSPPNEKTTVLLLYDDDALYVAFRSHESDSGQVNSRVLRQGAGLRGDDRIRIVVSPFNDNRSGYFFLLNPNGVRLEGIYKDGDFDRDWTGIWQGDGSITEDGWIAEVRIPFKTLSFTDGQDWGINFVREITRTQEQVGWVSRDRETGPSAVGTLTGLTNLSQGVGLDFVPSVSLNAGKIYDPSNTDTDVSPSLDVFYKVTPGLNASLTFNTDFSATEVDNRQVNLGRFNLFFPEKRAFFLRESDIFEFGAIGGDDRGSALSRADSENGRPYFSRQIGLSDNGQPVDLDIGAKISGRIGRWNIGAQILRQAEFEDVDATDILVSRISANVFAESTLGMMLTSGDPQSNASNTLYGIDYLYRNTRLANNRRLNASFWYQQSNTSGLNDDDAAYGIEISAPNNSGWRGGFEFKEIQQNFNPAVGFISRAGIQQITLNGGYRYRKNGKLIRNLSMQIEARRIDQIGGELQSQVVHIQPLEIENNSGDKIFIRHNIEKENLAQPFPIFDDITLPAGSYSFSNTEITLETGDHRAIAVEATLKSGSFFNGDIQGVDAEVQWRPSKYVNTTFRVRVDDVDLPEGRFISRLISTDVTLVFSNTLSWVNLVQYDNRSDNIGLNSRLHWVPQAGRNVYFVLNHYYRESPLDNRFHPTSTDLTLKADYTFRF